MTKPTLPSACLIEAGFTELGCWELSAQQTLAHSIDLPAKPGVYAFSINDTVRYVGLASRSIKQRLNFYRTPGVSQVTNIRLNALLCDHMGKGDVVTIMVAHPPDGAWNGLKISAAEGLEAGLIAEFDLPWNVRGSTAFSRPLQATPSTGAQTNVRQRILEQIRKRPGMTELELAKFIFGPNAVQPQANTPCRRLVEDGLVERRGSGGASSPYVYYPKG